MMKQPRACHSDDREESQDKRLKRTEILKYKNTVLLMIRGAALQLVARLRSRRNLCNEFDANSSVFKTTF